MEKGRTIGTYEKYKNLHKLLLFHPAYDYRDGVHKFKLFFIKRLWLNSNKDLSLQECKLRIFVGRKRLGKEA